MQTKRFRYVLGLVLAFSLVAAACGDDDSGGTTEATDAPVTTGADEFVPGPLGAVEIGPGEAVEIRALQAISGEVGPLGTDQVRGIELAIEDFGQVLGHDVNLGTPEDDLCSAEGGQAGAQAILAQENVLAVIGTTCSGAAAAAVGPLSDAGLVLVSGSNTSPSLTSDLAGTAGENWRPGYYRTAHNDLFQGGTSARFAFEELGLTQAAAIHDGDPYTQGLAQAFADAFTELGGTVTVFTAVNKGDTDMTAVLTEVAGGAPEVVYFPIFQPEGDFIIQQSGGIAGLEGVVWFGADGILVDSFMELPESAGMYFSGPDLRFGANTSGRTGLSYDQLVADYEAAYGEAPPAAFHAHTYDATIMVLEAIESVAVAGGDGTLFVDRQALRDALTATSGFQGVTGTLSCDDFGDCGAQTISIVQHLDPSDVAAGKSNVVYSFAPAAGGTAEGSPQASGLEGIPDFCLEIVGAADTTADGSGVNVGLTFDLLGRGDNSFNDAAACGVDTAVFYTGISYTEITPTDEAARATDLQLQAENSDLVIGNGFSFESAFPEVCQNNPDVNFAITDSAMLDFGQDPPAPYCDNTRGMVFAEHEGSYLVGVAAALKSTTGKIGFIGGVSGIGLIERFEAGFVAGARSINPDIEVVVEYVSEFPDFAGFGSPDRGREIGSAMYDEGADVIYTAAGLTGSGTHLAAKDFSEANGVQVWSIGVDSDEFLTQDEAVRPYILTSMLKRVDTAVFNAIVDHLTGNFTAGPVEYNLAAGGVGYSTSGGFVDDIADQIEAAAAAIIAGDVVVPSVPE